jgi:hypothetical protein
MAVATSTCEPYPAGRRFIQPWTDCSKGAHWVIYNAGFDLRRYIDTRRSPRPPTETYRPLRANVDTHIPWLPKIGEVDHIQPP